MAHDEERIGATNGRFNGTHQRSRNELMVIDNSVKKDIVPMKMGSEMAKVNADVQKVLSGAISSMEGVTAEVRDIMRGCDAKMVFNGDLQVIVRQDETVYVAKRRLLIERSR